MNNTFKYALSVVLGAAMVVPTLAAEKSGKCCSKKSVSASEVFPDVPANHWAYSALENMRKAGVLDGMPNGKFCGNKAFTRYEFAAAVNRAYSSLKNMVDGVSGSLKDVKDAISEYGDVAHGVDKFKTALDNMEHDAKEIKAFKAEADNLRMLVNEFSPELKGMKSDVDSMKRNLDVLSGKVSDMESRMTVVPFGEVNFSKTFLYNWNEKVQGENSQGEKAGSKDGDKFVNPDWRNNFNYNADVAFGVKGNVEGGPKWAGQFTLDTGSNVKLRKLNVSQDFNVSGVTLTLGGGRDAYRMSDALMYKSDRTNYFSMDRYQKNGSYTLDGCNVSVAYNPFKVCAFYAKPNNTKSVDAAFVAGAKVNLDNLFDRVNVEAGGNWVDNGAKAGHVAFGFDADVDVYAGVKVNGGFNMSKKRADDKFVSDEKDNMYFYGGLSGSVDSYGLDVSVGYTGVQKGFASLGEFDVIGNESDAAMRGLHGGKLSAAWNYGSFKVKASGHYLMGLKDNDGKYSGLEDKGYLVDVNPSVSYDYNDWVSATVKGCYVGKKASENADVSSDATVAAFVDLTPAKNTTWRGGVEYRGTNTGEKDAEWAGAVTPFAAVNFTF